MKAELHPIPEGNGKYTLPAASFNLTPEERRAICTFLRGINGPTGFSSNVKRLVSMKDLSIKNYKAHDCHVMLTVFLPIAIRSSHHPHVLLLFKDLIEDDCKKELSDLHDFMVETQNKLEMCLPPTFF